MTSRLGRIRLGNPATGVEELALERERALGDPGRLDLPAGGGGIDELPAGARVIRNDSGTRDFIGSGPPAGTGVHRYYFVVDALDTELDLADDATSAVLGFNRHFHSLARGVLFGTADPAER